MKGHDPTPQYLNRILCLLFASDETYEECRLHPDEFPGITGPKNTTYRTLQVLKTLTLKTLKFKTLKTLITLVKILKTLKTLKTLKKP